MVRIHGSKTRRLLLESLSEGTTMRIMALSLALTFVCAAGGVGLKEVTFEYFNLSTNEIWVTGITGLPPDATPGRLRPSLEELPSEVKAYVFSEAVRIKERLAIIWKDNGKKGWPGGLEVPGSAPPGVAHKADLGRDDLGIPAKVSSGKIRFTYLGNEKWRVKLLKP